MIDPLTVRIHMSRPDSTLDWYLAESYVMPKHIRESAEKKITFRKLGPGGSGPITEVTSVQSNQIEVCRNPHDHLADQGLPFLDCIRFCQYSDNTRIWPALMTDEIDWGSNIIADIDRTFAARNPEAHGFRSHRSCFYLVAFCVAITFNFLIPRLMSGDPVDAIFAAAGGRMPPKMLAACRDQPCAATQADREGRTHHRAGCVDPAGDSELDGGHEAGGNRLHVYHP